MLTKLRIGMHIFLVICLLFLVLSIFWMINEIVFSLGVALAIWFVAYFVIRKAKKIKKRGTVVV